MKQGIIKNGTVIGGRYRIKRLIGTGGMSRVYLVEDPRIGKEWAMKVAAKGSDDSDQLDRKRIAAEISVLQKLSHPGLPRIVDAVESDSVICIIMDYIDGRTLQEIVEERGALPQADVVNWGIQLADVLEYLHGLNPPIIYRDMKPGNIMLREDGRVVLFDFGIAREYKIDSLSDTTCLGTLGYAAPEQFGGCGQSDERTDVFGLGACLFHLLTGVDPAKPPYEIVPIRTLRPALSSGLERIIENCTQRNPEDRYRSCRELKAALADFHCFDDLFLKEEKRKMLMFASSILMGIIFSVLCVLFGAKVVEGRRNNYTRLVTEAGNLAAVSLYSGKYDPSVLEKYSEAIDLEPSREEAYLDLLDYCVDIGTTSPGLTAVCARIDTGREKKLEEVICRVAEIYFSGNQLDPDFEVNYRRASRYYAMVDPEVYPEAAGCAAIARAMGNFGRDIDWNLISEEMKVFSEWSDGIVRNPGELRNALLAADIYLSNSEEFNTIGIDPYGEAELLLTKSIEALNELGIGNEDLRELSREMTIRLAGIYSMKPETAKQAVGLYTGLIETEENEFRRRRYWFEKAKSAADSGDRYDAENVFEELIGAYPEDAEAWLTYCSWLAEIGDHEQAELWFHRGERRCDLSSGPNYEKLLKVLEEENW